MRATRFASVLAISLVVLPACDDDVPLNPVYAGWLEWSDSVVAGVPFGVRLRGLNAFRSHLRVEVRLVGDTLTITPYSPGWNCRGPCHPTSIPSYDTLVWVGGITATTPRTLTIRAPSPVHASGSPWPLHTFGTLTVSVDTPVAPHMRAVGFAWGHKTPSGCFMVAPPSLFLDYVSADQAPPWAPEFRGFVYGRIDPVLRSTCLDDAYVIQIDSIIP